MNQRKYPKGITFSSDENRNLRWCYERRVLGKRYRTFFSTMEAAVAAKRIAEEQCAAGADARRIFGAEAQREYDAAKRIVGEEVSLVEAALFWREHESLRVQHTKTVSEFVQEYLDGIRRRELSPLTLAKNKLWLSRFSRKFGPRKLTSFSGNELTQWASSLKGAPFTLATGAKVVNAFFNGAKSREYVREAPRIDLKMLPRVAKTPVETISTEQAEAALRAVRERAPRLLANFVLRLFCGLRTAEAARMRWEWIDEPRRRIVVPASICKTRDDWVLQSPALPPAVFDWLAVVPESEKRGTVESSPAELSAALPFRLPSNALRHTFCTMHISLENSAEKTALLLRHKGTSMLYGHYLAKLVTHEDAVAFFSLRP